MANIAMIVSNSCNPDPRVEKEAEALLSAGHEVSIHCLDRQENSPTIENKNGLIFKRYKVGLTPLGAPNIKVGINVLRKLVKFRKHTIKFLGNNIPDIVHCHDADTLEVGIYMKKKYSTKLVFDMHDLAHTWIRMAKPKSILRKFTSKIIERRLNQRLKFCDLIITSSGKISDSPHTGFKEWIEKRYDKEVIVIENRPILHDEISKLPDKFTIGYFGKIREPSMFQNLLEAVKNWPDNNRPKIIIAGHGSAEKEVFEMFKESEFDVEFHGKFNQDKLKELIKKISVMYALYPTKRGNILDGAIATKMFDSAAGGRPSIVNNECLMGDIAENENIGVQIASNKPHKLLEELLKIKENQVQVKLFRGWTEEAKKLIQAYKKFEILA